MYPTCGIWSMNGPKDKENTDNTAKPSLIRLPNKNVDQEVCTPSVEDIMKQYTLSKYTTYTGAIYRNICLKFKSMANQRAEVIKLHCKNNITVIFIYTVALLHTFNMHILTLIILPIDKSKIPNKKPLY